MEIKLTTEQIVREEKTFNIELPFFYHWQSIYATDSDSLYDMQEDVWGIVYLTKDEYNDDVIRTTRFKETLREGCGYDKSNAKYDIESEEFYEYRQGKDLEEWIKYQCTQDEFMRESTRIFKSITNQ